MKALIIVAENFQDEEFVYPFYYLQRFCAVVDVASVDGKNRFGKYGVPARVNTTFKESLENGLYDVVIVPGGFECPDRLRIIPEVKQLIRTHYENKKIVAAICHGPWVLISSISLKNIRMTGFKAIKDDLVNAGAIYEDENVVVDNNIITSPHYAQNAIFMDTVAKALMPVQ